MKIRLSIVLAITLALCFALCGCASQQPESNEPDYQDAAFLADLAKGLEARWDLNNDFAAENPDGLETSESMKSYVQAEIDAVGDYANAEFEDPKLREYAVSYINILNECLDAAGSYSTNNIESLTRWTDLYNERTMLLKDIVSEYEVPISSEYQSNLSDIVANGNAAQKTEEVESALQAVADTAQFVFEPDEYGYLHNGTATVTNNTGTDFAAVIFDVQMYDENGVRIESTTASVNNWNDGETVVLTAYITTGVAPASVKVVPNYYELAS